ncbi:hypothetical protein KRX56_08055 [Dermabacteraceae bacterium TAE3-ERU27]|nr:hypothetical protein [Dermabacteraceae bacterium TAE3-ERU27]
MSVAAKTVRPLRVAERPRLSVVSSPSRRRGNTVTALLATAILGAALAICLLLNISLSNGSYELSALQHQSAALENTKAELVRESERLSTPQELARRAESIGMVPASGASYIDLNSNTIMETPGQAEQRRPASNVVPVAAIYRTGPTYYGMGNERG